MLKSDSRRKQLEGEFILRYNYYLQRIKVFRKKSENHLKVL